MVIFAFFKKHTFKIVIACLLIAAGLVFYSLSFGPFKRPVIANKGYIDLSSWDFEHNGNIDLRGDWAFYWHRFIRTSQGESRPDKPSAYVPQPGTWDRLTIDGRELPGYGWSSYRLRVKIKDTGEIMGVMVKPMSTAYELWIDGKLVTSNGEIGTSRQTMKPQYLNRIAFFNPTGNEIEFVLQVSNFYHRTGGVWRPIILGTADQIVKESQIKQGVEWIQAISLAILAFYHLIVFFQRRKEKIGFFLFGFLLFMSLRVLLSGERILYTLLQNFSWEFCHKLEYLSIMVSMPFLAAFVSALYPDETNRTVIRGFNIYSAISVLVVIFTTAAIYSWTIIPYEIASVLIGLYMLVIFVIAIRHQRKYSRIMLIGAVILWLLGVNDALYANHIIFSMEAFKYGILLMGLFQTFVLSRIFVEALDTSERLTVELADKNRLLNVLAEKKEIRSRKLEQQLFRSQKLEAIGTLTGGIAHDFNNILGTMLGYIEMLIDQKPANSEEHQYLDEVYKAGERAADLVKQILTFSRTSETDLKPMRVAPIIKEILKMLRATLPATIEIQQSIESPDDVIMANEAQIHQIIINLFNNASQAIEDQTGTIRLTMDRVEIVDDEAMLKELNKGPHLRLAITDTGKGMSQQVLERVFDPFFTTKEIGSGTGLGLSVVHGIVKNHSGEITVFSRPNEGTTFTIYFPIVEQKSETVPLAQQPVLKGSGNILLVDDEVSLAKFYQLSLQKMGYRVTVARNARDVLAKFQSEGNRYDLLVTDQAMPEISGIQLSEKMREIRSDIPIILVTGYQTPDLAKKADKVGIVTILNKPIKSSELGLAIHSALSGTTKDSPVSG